MKKSIRFLTMILAALLVFAMVSSVGYIAVEADHNCIGEHCQICQQIEVCKNTLKQLSFGVAVAAFAVALAYVVCLALSHVAVEKFRFTLVSLKIKLSN